MVLSLSRSLPAVLPSFSVVAVTSRMSSTTCDQHTTSFARVTLLLKLLRELTTADKAGAAFL